MGKKRVFDDVRVVIYPDSWGRQREKENLLNVCHNIAGVIRRAVQAGFIDDVARVDVEGSAKHICEHCGDEWPDSDAPWAHGKPGDPFWCCEEAKQEWEQILSKSTCASCRNDVYEWDGCYWHARDYSPADIVADSGRCQTQAEST